MSGTDLVQAVPPPQPVHKTDSTSIVNEETRQQVVDYLGPEFSYLHNSPLWSAEALSGYMRRFWVDLHETQSSAVHRASFR